MKTITNGDAVCLVLDEIEAARERAEAAKAEKIRLIRLGRHHNIPWRAIAEKLGVTDAAVIRLVQRAEAAEDAA